VSRRKKDSTVSIKSGTMAWLTLNTNQLKNCGGTGGAVSV